MTTYTERGSRIGYAKIRWHGRRIILSGVEFPDGRCEVGAFYASTMLEVEPYKRMNDRDEAEKYFASLLARYTEEANSDELPERYAQLAQHFAEAKSFAEAVAQGEDSGTFNLDTPVVILPRLKKDLVILAGRKAGLDIHPDARTNGAGAFSVFGLPGFQSARTRSAEAFAKAMQETRLHRICQLHDRLSASGHDPCAVGIHRLPHRETALGSIATSAKKRGLYLANMPS